MSSEGEISPRSPVGKTPFTVNTTNIFLPNIESKTSVHDEETTKRRKPHDHENRVKQSGKDQKQSGISDHTQSGKSDKKQSGKADQKHSRSHRAKKSNSKRHHDGNMQEVNLLCICGNTGKEKDDMKLPNLVVDSTRDSIDFKTTTPCFVNNYKKVMEKKGIAIQEMFAHYRHKPNKNKVSDTFSDFSNESFASSELKLPSIAGPDTNDLDNYKTVSRMSETDSDLTSGYGDGDTEENRRLDMEKKFKIRLGDLVEEYEQTPGFRPRKSSRSRKLGGVVSSDRLTHMLEKNTPMKMESCYNYYLDD